MNRKNMISGVLFLALMFLTMFIIFKDNNIVTIWQEVKQLKPSYLFGTILTALFFVSAEGMMIWYLLQALDCSTTLVGCITYSFIGFFFSGITPSATGGQPMQLYYMKKSGLRVSDSTVVLMTVALLYKFVIVLMGIGILFFFWGPLHSYLGNYIYLYYLGLFLNFFLVAVLLFVMINPRCFGSIVTAGERFLIKLHIVKPSITRSEKLSEMVHNYHEAVLFFLRHKKHIACVMVFTTIQRCSLFFLTWLIYKGMGLSGHSLATVVLLQAAVYIAVDMLPLPGSQGITELMYKTVFSTVFPGTALVTSMCITRGISFYFLLIISGLIMAVYRCK